MPAEMCSFYSCDRGSTVINHVQFYLDLQLSAGRSLSLTLASSSPLRTANTKSGDLPNGCDAWAGPVS